MKMNELTAVLATVPRTVNLYIQGSAGAGKTAGINAHYSDRSKYHVEYMCPAQQEATESAGIPTVVSHDGRDYCGKALPQWFYRVEQAALAGLIPVIFVDELDKASMAVQNALLELFGRTRSLGGVKLPDSAILIAAGNRAEDRSGSQKMSMALANRLMGITLDIDANQWLTWATTEGGIHPTVTAYISLRPENLDAFDETSKQYPSPRTWEAVSDCMKSGMGNLPLNLLMETCCGLLGKAVGTEFAAIADSLRHLPCSVEQVWQDGSKAPLPTETSATYAICTALIGRSETVEQINECIAYASRLPAAFAVLVGDALCRMPERKPLLKQCKAYTGYALKFGDQLLAAIK